MTGSVLAVDLASVLDALGPFAATVVGAVIVAWALLVLGFVVLVLTWDRR